MPLTVTVSQMNRRIALMISGDKTLSDILVTGEISNYVNHYKSGHIYFTLKDENSGIKCVMFASNAKDLTFSPENGMTVTVRCSVRVYERDGQYQLYVSEMTPDGLGALFLEFEALKKRLDTEGLFEQKRPLPHLPKKIALVTSKDGAALKDILSVIGRRFPLVELVLIPVLVQGEGAPDSIVTGIEKAAGTNSDLIIFGRGGGACEDLRAFNSEKVARAVYHSPIPTISAVGHERDFTIGDFVADLRAPTPSAAAEMAVPDIEGIRRFLLEFQNGMKSNYNRRIQKAELLLNSKKNEIALKSPQFKIETAAQDLNLFQERINNKVRSIYMKRVSEFLNTSEVINSLNPLRIMAKGYSLVYKGDKIIRKSKDLSVGDNVKIKMYDGEVNAVIR